MHKHFWRIVRNGNHTDYFFVCRCQKRKVIDKTIFWSVSTH